MGIIKSLDKKVYEKIAAGEVIDRPSAVLRELLDNSIDANSSNVKINFERGGLDYISVADDGDGIYFQDLKKAPLKHYTSKITSFEDIYNIYSMGFRGEALSSIASVSRLRITSFNSQEEHGGELICEGGENASIKPFARSKGTTVEVSDLFYNVPVRNKFTKSVNAETRSIKDIFYKKTLVYNDISFSLVNQGKTVADVPAQKLIKRIVDYYGNNFKEKELIEIKSTESEQSVKVKGFVSVPGVYYHNRSFQLIYVNKRPVVIPSLYYAISNAFEGLIPGNKFPFAFIFIEIPPSKIDVNIHPAKKEIKFFDERFIFSLVKNAIIDSFKKGFEIDNIKVQNNSENKITNKVQNNENNEWIYKSSETTEKPVIKYHDTYELPVETRQPFSNNLIEKPETVGNVKIYGIIFDTYLLAQKQSDFYIIDYHAAHERINYERLRKKYSDFNRGIEKQNLLTPITFELSPEESSIFVDNKDLFDKLGYEITEFGGNSFVVNTIPAFKIYGDDKDILLKLVNKILKNKDFSGDDLQDELLKMQSCRMSVKAKDNPSPGQMSNLLDEILDSSFPNTCPHGRPILKKISKSELDKNFLRNR